MHLGKFWLSLVLLLTLNATASAQTRWASYANARFGTTADYPADLFTRRDPPPENGDGVRMHTADDRATLTIYGAYNAENDTPASYFQRLVDKDGVTYKQVTKTYYAASGVRGADIFYERCNFRKGDRATVDCFQIIYPAREKTAWDAIVTRISKSLRPGKGIAD
jgi:hypothetical protein